MEIKVGKYTLKSDRYSTWIEEEYKSEDEKTKGKTMTRRVAGYCQSFNRLLEDFIDKGIKDSDAKSVEEALSVLCKATRDAKKISKEAAEKNFRIIRHKESEGK